VFGVWEEESQSYYAHESVGIGAVEGNALGLGGPYKAVDTCSVIHAEGSDVLATFSDQYFAGSPALTVNAFGKGKAYYIAARTDGAFLADLYGKLVAELGIEKALDTELPAGVTAQLRTDGESRFVFVMNFNDHAVKVQLDATYTDLLGGGEVSGVLELERYGVRVLRR